MCWHTDKPFTNTKHRRDKEHNGRNEPDKCTMKEYLITCIKRSHDILKITSCRKALSRTYKHLHDWLYLHENEGAAKTMTTGIYISRECRSQMTGKQLTCRSSSCSLKVPKLPSPWLSTLPLPRVNVVFLLQVNNAIVMGPDPSEKESQVNLTDAPILTTSTDKLSYRRAVGWAFKLRL